MCSMSTCDDCNKTHPVHFVWASALSKNFNKKNFFFVKFLTPEWVFGPKKCKKNLKKIDKLKFQPIHPVFDHKMKESTP